MLKRVLAVHQPDPLVLPKGWQRKKALNLAVEFTAKNGREPTQAEIDCLKKAVKKAWQGVHIGREGEWAFEHGWIAGLMTIKKGRCLTKKEWDAGENDHDPKARSAGGRARVLVRNRIIVWRRSHPSGFFSGLGHFLSKAVKVVTKIPVLGSIAKIAASPFQMMGAIASGQRLDKAVLGAIKNQVNAVRDVAPYAQMVVSLVPGVGTGISAAMGAAIALSKGRPITEAVMAGIKGALPGGPIAATGFDMAMSVAHGKPVLESVLHAARDQLPPIAQKAFDIGLSVAQGRKLQNVIKDAVVNLAPDQVKDMVKSGTKLLSAAPGMLEAAKHITNPKALDGFKFATGLLGHAGLNEEHITALRTKLSPIAKQGFDAALDLQKATIPWIDKVKAPVLEYEPIPLASVDDVLPEGAIPIASVGGVGYYMPADSDVVSGGYYF